MVGFPVPGTSFVGRRHELAQARRLLVATRLLTLTGPGGVGKTRLAGRVAEGAVRGFPDGARLVPLAAVRDGALVPHAVADALGIRDEAGRAPLDTVVAHLRDRRLLLVLDNCEHVTAACTSLVASVLAAAEGVRVLATSRHRLGLPDERLLAVTPLATPPPGGNLPPGDDLPGPEFPALRLFADRAAAVAPGFAITDRNRAAVARLCHRLDGLPLAIELAAVRMHALGVEQLDERLGERLGDRPGAHFRLLTCGSPAAPPRHQTLRSAVDWSHDLCTPAEQLAWARLSVFTGSFDLAGAEAVCGEVRDALLGLVEKSVLIREAAGKGGGAGGTRYRMLALLREYGLEKLDALGAVGESRRRLCAHFVRVAEVHERSWFGPDQPGKLAGLRAEHDNLRAVLDFCLTTPGESPRGLRLVGSLWFYWIARGAWAELRHWWQRLAPREGRRPAPELTRAHWAAALFPLVRSRTNAVLLSGAPHPPTLAAHETPEVRPLTEVLGIPRGPTGQARHAGRTGQNHQAGLAEQTEQDRQAGQAEQAGQDRQAEQAGQDRQAEQAGQDRQAEQAGQDRQAEQTEQTEQTEQATYAGHVGRAGHVPGRASRGAIEEPSDEPANGAPEVGPRAGPEAHPTADENPLLAFHVLSRVELATTLTFHGRPERAVPLCVEALAVCEAHGEQWVRSYVLGALATARWALGEYEAAAESARRCLRLPYVAGEPHAVGGTLEILAVVTAARGDAERAAVLRGAAQRIWYDLGHDPLAGQRQAHGPPGDTPYDEAHRRGYELSVREALAYALGEPLRPRRTAPPVPDTGLTRREFEVAALIASGMTNRQIAERLVISRRTAEGHAERILAKLGFAARSQVAAWFSGLPR
ncbi:LuxR C-terminal-related transcriptional regulator [Streptomyces sp. NPDC047042]|uniref:LuxR C-terminal-related transcriptional regulator n=1 Tax=Streptomyces sp. NPDC047042 TaxID=3154807 RepID=UPI0033C72032